MKVAIFQQYLKNLVDPLTASGAQKKVLEDIERTCQELEPFVDKEFGELADFLKRAQQYEVEGHWSNSAGDDLPGLAKRLSELVGKPGLEAQLKPVKKMKLPRLRELCKLLNLQLNVNTKPELLEAIFVHLKASRTPEAIERLKALKAKADPPDADYALVENELDFLETFDTDEMIRIAEAFGVILLGKTREQALEAVRRKVLEKKHAKDMIAY